MNPFCKKEQLHPFCKKKTNEYYMSYFNMLYVHSGTYNTAINNIDKVVKYVSTQAELH